MANELAQFLLQYTCTILACFIFFFLGIIILKIFPIAPLKNNKWFYSYAAIVLGIVMSVLIYSIIMAKGKTINILILPVLIGLFFTRKNNLVFTDNEKGFDSLPIILLLFIPFLFVFLFHLFPESEYKQYDAVRYLQISQSFNNVGTENNFGSLAMFGKPYVGAIPYHYFEFWLNAILLKCFSAMLPSIHILRFVCYGVISTAALLGLFAVAENISKKPLRFGQYVVCICFIFYLPNFLEHIHFLKPILIYSFENNMLERPNLRTFYLFLPGLLITLQKNEYKWQSLFWIVCAIISSLINFVVLVPATILFCIIAIKIKGNKQHVFFILCGILLTVLLYLLFYYFFTSNIKITPIGITKQTIIAYFLRYWKIVLFSSFTSIFYCVVFPLLFFFIIKKEKRKQLFSAVIVNKLMIIFACSAIFCAIVIARALNFMDNSYQFAFLGYALGGIFFFIIFCLALPLFKNKNLIYSCVCLFFLSTFLISRFVFTNKYKNVFNQNGTDMYGGKMFSEDYINNLSTAFPAGSNVRGAFWADAKFYDSLPQYSSRNPNAYALPSAYILAGRLNASYEICLSDSASIMYGIDTTQKFSYDYVKSGIIYSPFYQLKQNGTINNQRLSFIKKYKLQYLILTKNADTSVISQLPILNHFKDNITGEQFYVIDNAHH